MKGTIALTRGRRQRKSFQHLAMLRPLFLRHGGKEGLASDNVKFLLQLCVSCKGSERSPSLLSILQLGTLRFND